tara:strand:- start:4047 stop:4994 length:948 start_codon:yes stop_codon:yes gene_type:complete
LKSEDTTPCILISKKDNILNLSTLLENGNWCVVASKFINVSTLKYPYAYVTSSAQNYKQCDDIINPDTNLTILTKDYNKYLLRHKQKTSDNPETVIMFGSPCAGKSTVLKMKKIDGIDTKQFVCVDPDEARMFSLDYQACLSGKLYADNRKKKPNTIWYHKDLDTPPIPGYVEDGYYVVPKNAFDRSVHIVRNVREKIFKWVLKENYNALYDSTCARDLNFCAKNVFRSDIRPRTYIGVYAPLEDIITRCKVRGEKEGRFVRTRILQEDHEKLYGVGNNKLKAYEFFKSSLNTKDKIFMYDNTNDKLELIEQFPE